MALDKLVALESRVKDLVKVIQDLRQKNHALEQEVGATRARLVAQDEANSRYEQERAEIRARVEKVLSEIDILEAWEEPKEVSLGEDR